MYIINIEKKFANTSVLEELLKLFTGTNKYNSSPTLKFDKQNAKKSCSISVDVNATTFYIDLWLKVENDNFIDNSFSIEAYTDDKSNILEWEHFDSINRILSEYWRYVRPNLNCY